MLSFAPLEKFAIHGGDDIKKVSIPYRKSRVKVPSFLTGFAERVFQFFIPSQCPCCGRPLREETQGLCSDCHSKIRWIKPPFCSVCGTPFISEETDSHLCGTCLTKKRYFTTARALGSYEGSLQKAIHQWKYEGKEYLSILFAEWMAEGLYRYWDPDLFNLLIPVPLHKKRLRERGFNQALLLVKELSRRTGIPFRRRVLRKKRPTPPQVKLNGVGRQKGVRGAFQMMTREEVEGKSILLVDDVYTTGATVNECSKVLMAGGARRVDVLTLAHVIKNV